MLSGITAKSAFRFGRRSDSERDSNDKASKSAARNSHKGVVAEDETVEAVGLRELNGSLDVLANVFPNIRVEVFREMLLSFSPESRLQLITEALLSKKDKYVKGRWLAPGQQTLLPSSKIDTVMIHMLEARDRFRSSAYKEAAKEMLYQEFKGLSHSSIRAVLAENNNSYTLSRPVLLDLVTKSWRFALTNLFGRRRIPSTQEHPLIEWRDLAKGHCNPYLRSTASDELNDELEHTVLRPLLKQLELERTCRDRQYAEELNEREAEEAGALYDCTCCFVPYPVESLSSCAASGHLVCFSCIRHTFNEALYGQGWSSSVADSHASLLCIAAGTGKNDPRCASYLPAFLVRRAIQDSANGLESWRKFEQRLAANSIAASKLSISSCPACCYAEAEPPPPRLSFHIFILVFLNAQLPHVPFPLSVVLPIPYVLYLTFSVDSITMLAQQPLHFIGFLVTLIVSIASLLRRLRPDVAAPRRHPYNGRKFVCRNPACLRASCLHCRSAWHDPHTCFSGARTSLRLFVESAVTQATTRTCPSCDISFVKESGCNKMTCPRCGYAMCWVCRAKIGAREGYGHFCPHFRPDGEAECSECSRCDLYRVEDERALVERVRREAEEEWWEREGLDQVGGANAAEGGAVVGSREVRRAGSEWIREGSASGRGHDDRGGDDINDDNDDDAGKGKARGLRARAGRLFG